jgi:hypothetical protein
MLSKYSFYDFQGFLFYLPTFATYGISGFRMLIFMILYETLIKSLLYGWIKERPQVNLYFKVEREEWKKTKEKVKSWIQFYHIIEVKFFQFSIRKLQKRNFSYFLTVFIVVLNNSTMIVYIF